MGRAKAKTSHFELSLSPRIKLSFQRIEPGEFRMGARGEYADEEPIHLVRITRPFYLGTYPVTQAQFAAWTKTAGVDHQNDFKDKPSHPAENMNWHQASAFCDWLNKEFASQLPTGYVATLPTEAQWEYACRAGTDTEYYTGDGVAALDTTGWFDENSDGKTHPVGRKQPNAWGLYDMHGNVLEWCVDAWDDDAYKMHPDGITDPVSHVDQKNPDRVLRGGSWFFGAWVCRSSFRVRFRADVRDRFVGFRVCLVPGPVPSPGGGAPEVSAAEPDCGDEDRGTRTKS